MEFLNRKFYCSILPGLVYRISLRYRRRFFFKIFYLFNYFFYLALWENLHSATAKFEWRNRTKPPLAKPLNASKHIQKCQLRRLLEILQKGAKTFFV